MARESKPSILVPRPRGLRDDKRAMGTRMMVIRGLKPGLEFTSVLETSHMTENTFLTSNAASWLKPTEYDVITDPRVIKNGFHSSVVCFGFLLLCAALSPIRCNITSF